MNLADKGDMIFGLMFIAGLVSIPFWEWAAKKWNKQKAYIAGMIFMASVIILIGFAKQELGLPVMLAFGVLAGFGLGAVQILTWAMIPDGVEWDEYQTGQRHEGMFYSLVTTIRKIAASISIPMLLVVLQWTGYDANLAAQPASAVRGIQALIGPIPAVFLVIGIIFAYFYPLSRERHAQLINDLAARHEAKKADH
jgi:GPH family glycoside/pentoside/hexuronide:cation symporter